MIGRILAGIAFIGIVAPLLPVAWISLGILMALLAPWIAGYFLLGLAGFVARKLSDN